MTYPFFNGFEYYEVTADTQITADIGTDIPPDAVGAMYQAVLCFEGPVTNPGSPAGGVTIPGFWEFKWGNTSAVGPTIAVYEHTVLSLIEGSYTWEWENPVDALLVIAWHELASGDLPGVIESDGFVDSDRAGTQTLDMGTIDPYWTSSDTSYVMYWCGDGSSNITFTDPDFSQVFIINHSNSSITAAGYSLGELGSDSFSPAAGGIDPDVDTLNWVGIAKALRKAELSEDTYLGYWGG